ncbi:MAG: AHH domain-containing protein [Chitinispirillaceae bacterium]|nr:AHH domain-containing protein [Chitinispirillaceae bacterium]
MSQFGEATAISAIQTDKHNDKTCPFCAEDKPQSKKNDLNNNASDLRTSCKTGDCLGHPEPIGSDAWTVVYIHPETNKDDISEVRSNPHHCIPGKASLKGDFEHPILEAIEKAKGTITADIGYNVNSKPNGIWLPTIIEHFYGGRTNVDPIAGIKWGELTKKYPNDQFSMAEAAMFEAKRQFHDAHPDYSEYVKGQLDKIFDKLILRKQKCPEAGPKAKPNVPPPYALVSWLNACSRGMAQHLSNDPTRWRDPIYTSRHAKSFQEKLTNQNRSNG